MTMLQKIEIERAVNNPLITPKDVKPSFPDWEVLGVFNAGVAEYQGEVILLLRVAECPRQNDPRHVLVPVLDVKVPNSVSEPAVQIEKVDKDDPNLDFSDPRVIRDREGGTVYLTTISHFRVARSQDGLTFTVEEKPSIWPTDPLERWGIEDPRITRLGDRYHIAYSAVSEKGVAVGRLTTADFASFRREGLILAPTNKDVALFPAEIDGKYYMLHRPVPEGIGQPEIWLAESPDLEHWGNHRFLMGLREGKWDGARIGAGCVPIQTEAGWLILYHGADRSHRYCMGAALLDLQDPGRILARMEEPLIVPEAEYETSGFFHSVIFACGAVLRGEQVMMYYGASDDSIACASFRLPQLLEALKPIA
ncbi:MULTISPECIES: glycoside hydrolase family 130 protein [Paenibacillus]|uniref:glycoside hydrolase family 130 protein n=1 Tax=Paenibacillus TaxID=44249 RepID=UPI00073F0BC8|nr:MULTISPECIES: glycoside hydrolase family 130 protein [Paenibacillus]MDU4694758.1 glycoside hydrolase family 130 protein [Paenibacillus sp.]